MSIKLPAPIPANSRKYFFLFKIAQPKDNLNSTKKLPYNSHIYINHKGKIESFDSKKATKGDEDIKTW